MKRLISNKFFWLALGILVLVIVLSTRMGETAKQSNVGVVTRGDLIQRVTVAGVVNPNRKTVLSAPYNGYVRRLYVQVGDKVKSGDPVISVAQSLKGSSEDVFPMRAPFAGTVVQVLRTEGEYVDQTASENKTLVRIDDLSQLFVEASSPEVEVVKLKEGQEVLIKASAILGRQYKGKIEHISLASKEQKDWDKSRVEFPVIIRILDADANLKPGMSVVIDIITNKLPKVLMLRHEFIQKDSEKYFVLTEKGQKKTIEVGVQNEEAFEIRSGVSEGERIQQTDFLSTLKSE